jgi:hypothetical protein
VQYATIKPMFERQISLDEIVAAVRTLSVGTDDSERIDRIRLLEELKSAAAAAQAAETVAFTASQRAAQSAQGVPADRVGRGITAQVALAKRMSPYHAQRYAGWAKILTAELPRTFLALRSGRTTEWRAMLVARETAWLSAEHRAVVDAEVAPQLEHLGDRRVEAEVKKLAYRLDPHGYVDRIKSAANERRVGLRPAPDMMARLTALLPVAQGVAAYAALGRHADACKAAGDTRSRGQIMADTAVERLTGQATASDVPLEINVVMTDGTLFGTNADQSEAANEPAHVDGYGPIPAPMARNLVFGAGDETPMWLRRLFTRPGDGELAAMDSRRRTFTPSQRHFLRLRDQFCRQPWCDAPIRHIDHIRPAQDDGSTSVNNGQGYCAACNYAKEAPGWIMRAPVPGARTIMIITPTGHRYASRAPDPPGTRLRRARSPVERRLAELLTAA